MEYRPFKKVVLWNSPRLVKYEIHVSLHEKLMDLAKSAYWHNTLFFNLE